MRSVYVCLINLHISLRFHEKYSKYFFHPFIEKEVSMPEKNVQNKSIKIDNVFSFSKAIVDLCPFYCTWVFGLLLIFVMRHRQVVSCHSVDNHLSTHVACAMCSFFPIFLCPSFHSLFFVIWCFVLYFFINFIRHVYRWRIVQVQKN